MVARYKLLVDHVQDVTVVFDKGTNAQDIIERLDGGPFRRTDQKLRVQAFYCVLALTLCSLMRKRLRDAEPRPIRDTPRLIHRHQIECMGSIVSPSIALK